MKIRDDIWTKEQDLLLAETVLRHIRTGSTQLQAFDEVGNKLNRTAAGCGFRWNKTIRYNYNEAILFAKKLRNDLKRHKKIFREKPEPKPVKVQEAPKQLEAVFEPVKEVKPQNIVKEVPKEIEKWDVIGYLLDLMNASENETIIKSIKDIIKYMIEPKKA